jgi:hypothetical protein
VRKARGSATAHRCVECGGPAREWAYNHAGGERERTETVPTVDDGSVTLAYSLSVDDYDPMCLPCHRRRDGAKRSGPSRGRARGVVTYGVAHQRVRTRRGSASAHPCVDCGQPAAHWSYDNRGGEDERVNAQGQRYSVDVTAYDPMCRPCHRRRDDDARDERAS